EREVVALAPEQPVGRHVDGDVEVAGRPAVAAGRALPLHPDPLPVGHADRDPDLDVPGAGLRPAAVARRAGLLHHLAAPAAAGADLGEGERPLVDGQRAGAVALRAGLGHGAGGGARSAAGVAGGGAGQLDGDGRPPDGVVERQVDLGLEVAAPPGPGPGLAVGLAAPGPAEEVAEQVAEAAHVAGLEADVTPEAARTAEAAGARPGERVRRPGGHHVADLVVLLPLGGVAEDVVGGGDVLELLLRLLVPGVGVGVVLLGQLAVGARDVLLGRPLLEPEHGVVVLFEPLPLRRHRLRSHLHHCGSQDPALEAVAAAHDVAYAR